MSISIKALSFLSLALTPQTGPAPEPFGSIDPSGTPYDINNMVYGNPPIEAALGLTRETWRAMVYSIPSFLEFEFYFSASMTTASVNTEDDPVHVPTGSGNDLYYQSFNVDVSNLLPGFGLHFDLHNTEFKTFGDIDVDTFARYSHDAGTSQSVPEPAAVSLLAMALLLLAGESPRLGNVAVWSL